MEMVLQGILANPFSGRAEQQKILENIKELSGYDIPFLLSTLMATEATGQLNIFPEEGEHIHITLSVGRLSQVNGDATDDQTMTLLVQKGYADQQEIDDFLSTHKGENLLHGMISENLLSPHIADLIKKEQMLLDIERLINDKGITIRFTKEPHNGDEPWHHLNLMDITPMLHNAIYHIIPSEFLKSFYQSWKKYPIIPGPQFAAKYRLEGFPLFVEAKELLENVAEKPLTIDRWISDHPEIKESVFKILHFLTLRKIVVFGEHPEEEDEEQEESHSDLISSQVRELEGKNFADIFIFFGSSPDLRPSEIDMIYKDFAKANHPDLLPRSTPESVRQDNHRLFSMITEAHDILMDPEKRQSYFENLKRKSAEIQMEAEDHFFFGLNLIETKQFEKALVEFEKANDLYESDSHKLEVIYGKLKLHPEWESRQVLSEIGPMLKTVNPLENKKKPSLSFCEGPL